MPRGLRNKKRQIRRRAIRQLPQGDAAGLILAESSGELEWLEAADGDGEKKLRKFRMVAYTGGKLQVRAYYYPVVVDLSGLKVSAKNRPVLRDHDISRVVGHTEQIAVNAGNITVSGVVSGDQNQHGQEVTALADNGFPWQVSIGANPTRMAFVDKGESVEVNGRRFTGPIYVARQSQLREVSFVALGADDNTSAKMAASFTPEGDMPTFEEWLQAKGFDADELSDDQTTSLQAMYQAEKAAGDNGGRNPGNGDSGAGDDIAAGGGGGTTPPVDSGDDGVDHIQARRDAEAAEVERVERINSICARYDNPTITENGEEVSLRAHAIRNGWNADRVELNALRGSRPQAPAAHRPDPKTGRVLEAAALISAGLTEDVVCAAYDEKTVNEAISARYQHTTLHVLMDQCISAAGMHYSGSRKSDDYIRAAFQANSRINAAGGANFSTLSLSGILSNVANKALIAAYEAVEVVWPSICAVRSHNDFKTHTRYRLDAEGSFKKIGKDGELKQASLSDDSYTNQLGTYGTILALTRQDMINDDLGSFLQIPQMLGRMAAVRIEEAVMVLLLSLQGSGFFASGNGNLMTGGSSALSIDALTTARQKFRDQVDVNGKPILVSPQILLVGTALEELANNLFSEDKVDVTTTANSRKFANNPHRGLFRPFVSPYLNNTNITDQDGAALSNQSATQWFLFANPMVRAALCVAFLNGRRTPTIESAETKFDTLGMQWRAYSDFGVGSEETVAAVKSAGA